MKNLLSNKTPQATRGGDVMVGIMLGVFFVYHFPSKATDKDFSGWGKDKIAQNSIKHSIIGLIGYSEQRSKPRAYNH